MSRFSRTVSSTSRVSSCGTTPRRARIAGPSVTGFMPRMTSSPALGGETQPIMRIVEDLPAPLGPRNPNASPRRSSKSMPSTAVNSPNRLVRPVAWISTSGWGTRVTLPNGSVSSEPITGQVRVTSATAGHPSTGGTVLSGSGSGGRGRRQIQQVSSIRKLYARFRQLIHEGFKFLVIGAVGFMVTFGVANALHPIGKYKAITIATILATAITYLGNRYWTFRHRQGKGTTRDSIMFFVLNGIGLLIYYGCIGLIDLAGLGHSVAWYNVALVVGTGLGTLFRFWSYRKWIWLAHPTSFAGSHEELPDDMAAVGVGPGTHDPGGDSRPREHADARREV